MEISDVRVKLIDDPGDRLKAVCTITFDDVFVVRDVKVVDGTNGLFVAMPSRKLTVHCPECKYKNHLRARFCNECGAELPPHRAAPDTNGRSRLHRDLAHPITVTFRELLQQQVIAAFQVEFVRAKDPDYEPKTLEEEEDEVEAPMTPERRMSEYDAMIAELKGMGAGEPVKQSASSGGRDGNRPRPSQPAPRGRETEPRRQPQEASRGAGTSSGAAPPRRRSNEAPQSGQVPQSSDDRASERRGDGRRPPPPSRPGERPSAPPPVYREPAEPAPVEKAPSALKAPAAAKPAVPEADEDSGFGAGIL